LRPAGGKQTEAGIFIFIGQ